LLKRLFAFLEKLLGNSVARVLFGGGMALASFAVLTTAITGALNATQGYIGGFGGDLLKIVLLAGVSDALTIIGAALLTRAAWEAGKPVVRFTGSNGGAAS
jgi:hypothetical protein